MAKIILTNPARHRSVATIASKHNDQFRNLFISREDFEGMSDSDRSITKIERRTISKEC